MGRKRENRIPFVWHSAHVLGIFVLILCYAKSDLIAQSVRYLGFALFLLNCLDMILAKYQMWNVEPLMPRENEYALITGASAGIGREIAYLLAEKKFNLILAARSEAVMERMEEEIKAVHRVRVRYCVCDLSTQKGIDTLIHFVAKEQLRISILINNAGSFDHKKFHELEMEQIMKLITLDLIAALQLTHAILHQMIERKQGHVMNIASLAAHTPVPQMALYAGLKSCLDRVTQAIAYELRDTGVLVTSFLPGPVNTNIYGANDAGDMVMARVSAYVMEPKDCARNAIEAMFNGCECAYDSVLSHLAAFVFQCVLPTRVRLAMADIGTTRKSVWGGGKKKVDL